MTPLKTPIFILSFFFRNRTYFLGSLVRPPRDEIFPFVKGNEIVSFVIMLELNPNLGAVFREPEDGFFSFVILLLLLLDFINSPAPVFGNVLDLNSNLGTIFRGPKDDFFSFVVLLLLLLDVTNCPASVLGIFLDLNSNLGTIGPTDEVFSFVFVLIPRLDFSTCPPPDFGIVLDFNSNLDTHLGGPTDRGVR